MQEKLKIELSKYGYISKGSIDVADRKIDIPVRYTDASALMVFFPIPLSLAKKILNSNRLIPVSILGGKSLLGVTFFDYRQSPADPYHEFTFSIPVNLDSSFNIPILPLISDRLFKNFGYNVLLMGADTDLSREHIKKIFPYPLVDKNLSIGLTEIEGELRAYIKDGDEEIISVVQKLPTKFRFADKKYNTYYENDGKIFNVHLQTFSYSSMIFKSGLTTVSIGTGQNSRILRELKCGVPLFSVYYKRAIEIADSPLEV